jgi:hypothetical protein
MYPSDDSHDLYIREKQLMLAGTAMFLAKQAADKANGTRDTGRDACTT